MVATPPETQGECSDERPPDSPSLPSKSQDQEASLTVRAQPLMSGTEDEPDTRCEIDSEEILSRPGTASTKDAEDSSSSLGSNDVAHRGSNSRAKEPIMAVGEVQTVQVPSQPSVINFRLNQIGIDLRKPFPDAPFFDGYDDDALELPLFVKYLRQKLQWDKDMYPTDQHQMLYALSRLGVTARSYFTEYITEDGSVKLDTLDDFIKILTEKHNESETAIESLKSTITKLESKLKKTESKLKRKEIRSGLHADIWPAFKQFFERKPPPAIQALVGKPKFYWQQSTNEETQPFSVDNEGRLPLEVWEEKWKNGREIPERIRINSPGLLRALKDASEGEWAVPEIPNDELDYQSVVFLRPYKFFWHYRENISKKKEELEEKVHKLEQNHTADETDSNAATQPEAGPRPSEAHGELHKARTLLEDLKCLIRFIDTAIAPAARKYREKEHVPQKITFADLWYLFQPGEIAFSRGLSEDDAHASSREDERSASQNTLSEPSAWKILDVAEGRPRLSPGLAEDELMQPGKIFDPLEIQCYKIDYDGSTMGPTVHYFSIEHFEGERDINSLNLVPLWCAKDRMKLQERFEYVGRRFLAVTKTAFCHQRYTGQKYTHCSNGAESRPAMDGLGLTPKRIHGSVIVDFATAYKEDPGWTSYLGIYEPLTTDSREFTEAWPFKVWKVKNEEKEASKRASEEKREQQSYHSTSMEECIYNDSHINRSIRLQLVSNDPFLREYERGSEDERITAEDFEKRFLKDNKLLLADKVCAYILDRMCFALLAVERLEDPPQESQGWNDLLLEQNHQTVIKALVKKHMTKHSQESAQRSRPTHDLVAGKGEGLIILLHGAPGLGKTSTVECLRDELRAPLLSLSCGNLGNDAKEIEENLDMLFYRAQLWNCLTLLDEADVVLMERSRDQFKENEVCSVFLRKLEYYQGVLFLTTNRVGLIDEAIKSRIHLAIHYPHLSEDVMEELLRNTLQRLKSSAEYKSRLDVNIRDVVKQCMKFLREECHPKSVNGRVIRNISQVAVALAEEELSEESSSKSLPLRWRHFEQALRFHANFESYLEDIRDNDSKRAKEMYIRSDEWSIVKKEK